MFLIFAAVSTTAQEDTDWMLEKVIEQLEERIGPNTFRANYDITLPEHMPEEEKPIRNGGRVVADSDRFVKLRGYSWMFAAQPLWYQMVGTDGAFGYRIAHMPVSSP